MSQSTEPWLIAIAASAGGIQALQTLLSELPSDLDAAVVIVQHRMPTSQSYLDAILARATRMPVHTARDGESIQPGIVYIARPDLHLTIGANHRFVYSNGTRVRAVLSSATRLFETAAPAFANRIIAVVLTGRGMDATDGVQTVKAHGGIVVAQDPATAASAGMPSAAIQSGAVDYILPLDAIAPLIAAIVRGEVTAASRAVADTRAS